MDSNKDILNTISDSNRRFAKKKREEDLLGVPEKVAAELEKAMEQEVSVKHHLISFMTGQVLLENRKIFRGTFIHMMIVHTI